MIRIVRVRMMLENETEVGRNIRFHTDFALPPTVFRFQFCGRFTGTGGVAVRREQE